MEIKPGKYRTRDGREAIVLEVFKGRAYGRVSFGESFRAEGWWINGKEIYLSESTLDLIAPWEEPREIWVWEYNNGNVGGMGTK